MRKRKEIKRASEGPKERKSERERRERKEKGKREE